MFRKPFHLPSALSLLLCVASVALWTRGGGSGSGDHFGWKRQQAEGHDWVHDEWSARSAAGRVQFVTFHKTTSPPGEMSPKAHIRFGEEGFFWKDAIEKAPAEKNPAEKAAIDIKKTTPRPTTAPSDVDAAKPPEKAFAVIDETTPTLRMRGVSMAHWVLIAVTALLPARWLLVTSRRRRSADGGGGGNPDSVPLGARLFASLASLSILLAFAFGLAWAKSWYIGDRVSWRDPNRPQFVDVHSGKGELVVHFRQVDENLARSNPELAIAANGFNWRQDANASVGYTPKTFCFENENQATKDGGGRAITVAAPYWFLVILALVPPSWWLRNQKFGPIRVTTFGRPAAPKDKGHVSIHSTQRPI